MPIKMSPRASIKIRDFGLDSFLLSVGLSFHHDSCSVLQEVHTFIAWPQSTNFVPRLSEELVALRASRNYGKEV